MLVEKGVSYSKESLEMMFVIQNVEHLNTRMRETNCSYRKFLNIFLLFLDFRGCLRFCHVLSYGMACVE
jgi:hypothetical protein